MRLVERLLNIMSLYYSFGCSDGLCGCDIKQHYVFNSFGLFFLADLFACGGVVHCKWKGMECVRIVSC